MAYVDYGYYSNVFKGNLDEETATKLLDEASDQVDRLTYGRIRKKAYLSDDREFKNLTLTIIGPTRAGKTTLISNIAKDAVDNGECTILFDFCGNNELSNEVSTVIPRHKVLNIDCSDSKKLQGLGYNEIKNTDDDVFKVYRDAKIQTSQLLTLVNSINTADKELLAKMDRFLESAALVVFINNGPIKDVFATLQNHRVRHDYINRIPENQTDNLDEYVISQVPHTQEFIRSKLSQMAKFITKLPPPIK